MTDRGSVTLWVLGLSILMIGFGGLALDFWRVLAVQRQAAAIVDAAAVAAASGIDEEHYRATGDVILDPQRATSLGLASVDAQGVDLVEMNVTVSTGGLSVEVVVVDEIEGGFIAFFTGEDGILRVTVTALAEPRLVP